jgi:hypothetical protein
MNTRCTVGLKAVGLVVSLLVALGVGGAVSGAHRRSKPVVIGMIPLLAAPQKYDGKVIRTWGFLNIGRIAEDDSLWLHKEDILASLLKDSFALELTQKQRRQFKSLNHTYVEVQGVMHSKGPAGPSLECGTISNITMVHGWTPFVPFAPKKKR